MSDEPGPAPPGIDRDLEMITSGVEALRDLASDTEKAQDGARVYDFSIRWGVLLSGRLKRLEHYYQAEALTDDQVQRYRELRHKLKDAAPQIERLGVAEATVPLED